MTYPDDTPKQFYQRDRSGAIVTNIGGSQGDFLHDPYAAFIALAPEVRHEDCVIPEPGIGYQALQRFPMDSPLKWSTSVNASIASPKCHIAQVAPFISSAAYLC